MRFAFVRPKQSSEWGGDLKAVFDLQEGLGSLGFDSFITSDVGESLQADEIVFIGTLIDQSPSLHFMRLCGRSYSCIPFHEDYLLYSGASFGLPYYLCSVLEKRTEDGIPFSLQALYERPHLIFYYDRMRPIYGLKNYEFLQKASRVIVSSPTEQKTVLRDAPSSQAQVVFWGAGYARGSFETPTEEFLSFAGVESGQYILQVGRLSCRKNQLATLLAAKDIEAPLVFIAMNHCNPVYEELFFQAATQWRKGPTILISQHLSKDASRGPLRVIPTSNGNILSANLLRSAFAHAGLHLHPAFYELPGYTYLESARFGVPTIASEWSSLKDYFQDSSGKSTLDDRIEYALPYDLPALSALVKKKWGQKYAPIPDHPVYQRTAVEIAKDFIIPFTV